MSWKDSWDRLFAALAAIRSIDAARSIFVKGVNKPTDNNHWRWFGTKVVGAFKPKRTFGLGWRGTALNNRLSRRGRNQPAHIKETPPMKLTIKDHPTGGPRVEYEEDGRDVFIVVNGVTIARRSYPDTSAAGIWVSLEPGWSVTSSEDLSQIEIMYDGKQVSFDGKQMSFHLRSGCGVR